MPPVPSIHLVYASTSGHTEYVASIVAETLRGKGMQVEMQRAELAKAEDLQRGDVLILAASSWNTGNVEGQLNPHMWTLLLDRAKELQLAGKTVACVGLGDERYFFTCKAADHLEAFVRSHGGALSEPTLRIINEPYGQERKVQEWAERFASSIS